MQAFSTRGPRFIKFMAVISFTLYPAYISSVVIVGFLFNKSSLNLYFLVVQGLVLYLSLVVIIIYNAFYPHHNIESNTWRGKDIKSKNQQQIKYKDKNYGNVIKNLGYTVSKLTTICTSTQHHIQYRYRCSWQ